MAAPKQPIAAIEKRVIDSPVYAKLPHSARSVLLLLARNLGKGRNGHVFLSVDDAEAHGVDKKTLYRSLKTLTQAGFIFPTSRGGHGKCGTYALTWLDLTKDTKGLYLQDYVPAAWRLRDSDLQEWKKRRGKMSPSGRQISPQKVETVDKLPPSHGTNFPTLKLSTNTHDKAKRAGRLDSGPENVARLGAYLARLNQAGLARGKHSERMSVRLSSLRDADRRAAA